MSTILRELLNDSPLNQFRNLYCYSVVRSHLSRHQYIVCIGDEKLFKTTHIQVLTDSMNFRISDSTNEFTPFIPGDLLTLKSLNTIIPFTLEFDYDTSKLLNQIIKELEKGLANEAASRNSR